MANAQGVNLGGVAGTGPGGRIIKADVQDAMAAGPTATSVAAPVFDSAPGGYIDH